MQASIDHTYRDFTAKVAAARKSTPEKVDAVAQGRVWSGKDALARGLVDRLGRYGDALESAATRAKLAKGYGVHYVEAAPGRPFAAVTHCLCTATLSAAQRPACAGACTSERPGPL